MRPLRVLHVVANPWWTGAAAPALDQAIALAARGHDVGFACIRGDVLEARARSAGLRPPDDLTLARTARPWVLLRDWRGLRRRLRDVDVVHVHQSHDHWLTELSRAGTGARLVRTVHHRRAVHRDPLTRWLLTRADAVIAASDAIAVRCRASGVTPGRLHVVGGSVDLGRFSPANDGGPIRRELGLGLAPVVGCVARMVPGRGHELLLEAAVRLRTRIPGVRLLLVGRGEHRPALERTVRALDLETQVVFAGYRGEDLPSTLAAMDVAVLLGSGSEESCRAVLEAMAAGRPVVATRVGAVPETVVDGETGRLVAATAEAVAWALAGLLGDPELARRMGAAGRRRAEACFSPTRMAEGIEVVYRTAGERQMGAST